MCWNETVSWTTFLIGTLLNVICAYLAPSNVRVWFLFFQLIITVQLGEALVWRNNPIGTYISFFCVWLQPIFLAFLLYYFNISPTLQYIAWSLILLYVVSSIESLKQLSNNLYVSEPCGACIDQSSHISFKAWNHRYMGFMYMICCLVFVSLLFTQFPYIVSYLLFTLIVSLTFYKNMYASLWCWFAVFTPVVYLVSHYATNA
jgi:hypothetical protein